MAEEFEKDKYAKRKKRRNMALILIAAGLTGAAIFALIAFGNYSSGQFTIRMKETVDTDLHLTMGTDPEKEMNTTYLKTGGYRPKTLFDANNLPDESVVDSNQDGGTSSGNLYFHYTFFIKNDSTKPLDFNQTMKVEKFYQGGGDVGLLDFLRIRIYCNSYQNPADFTDTTYLDHSNKITYGRLHDTEGYKRRDKDNDGYTYTNLYSKVAYNEVAGQYYDDRLDTGDGRDFSKNVSVDSWDKVFNPDAVDYQYDGSGNFVHDENGNVNIVPKSGTELEYSKGRELVSDENETIVPSGKKTANYGFCEPFDNDPLGKGYPENIFKTTYSAGAGGYIQPGQILRYTVLMWIEGTDPDSFGVSQNSIARSDIRLSLEIEAAEAAE